jgi:hypothetical protein
MLLILSPLLFTLKLRHFNYSTACLELQIEQKKRPSGPNVIRLLLI